MQRSQTYSPEYTKTWSEVIGMSDWEDPVDWARKYGRKANPERVLHMLQRVLDEVKDGSRDSAEFWMDREEMKVYIKFIAVRGKEGEYLGCLETSQDITDIMKIKGERITLT